MSFGLTCDEELVRRLPLPLAQLARRASNAKNPLDRHLAAYYLWEAALKLLSSAAIVAYAERAEHDPKLAERLENLARPAVGHWWEFVRALVPVLADAGEPGFAAVQQLLLGRARDDLPRAAGLDAALRETLEGSSGARTTVRPSELFDRLVRYRNRELGHGAAGQRAADYYDRMGRALLAGVCELLGHLDVLAGARLLYVSEVRRLGSGVWLVDRLKLEGESARRIESLDLPEADAARLPRPEQLYLETPGASMGRALGPLVLFDAETGEVLFLNARRDRKRVEYLCYSTGRVVDRQDLGGEQRALLARVLGMPVDTSAADAWAARSQAEEGGAAGAVQAAEEAPGRRMLGEFELLSELGRGGMGVVYRAWQPSLGRQVALKCLLRSGDAKAEARFMREIRALGRVEHRNLVRVFTSGSEGERWFYAMELVEGASLSAVADALAQRNTSATQLDVETWRSTLSTTWEESRKHEKSFTEAATGIPLDAPRQSLAQGAGAAASTLRPLAATTAAAGGGRSYVRHMAELVRQVAEAAHALHGCGVIHRDIKPGNIVVTADGRQAVLMDLGLAQLADEADGRLTRTRQFVGTLRYASPEQVLAAGGLTARSDVYSLGATLWELLTLQPLFGATEQTPTPELMQSIQFRDPGRPGRYNRAVPRDLEAIVLKCLEKDPARRYATAADLAADLDRFLRGELVTAQPLTFGYVAGKFVRRHRWPIAGAAALLLAALAGTAFSFYQIERALHEARLQRNLAMAQRQAAEENFRLARRAVDDYFTRVSESKLLDVPGMEPLRQELLEAAQRFYEDFLRKRASDPSLRAELASAAARVGYIHAQSLAPGSEQEALRAYRGALRIREALVTQFPQNREFQHDLGHSQTDLGNLLADLGQTEEARKAYDAARSIRAALASQEPAGAEYQLDLASIENNLGNLLHDTGQSVQALESHERALTIRRRLVASHPHVADYRHDLAKGLYNLGRLEAEVGRTCEAVDHEKEAQALSEKLTSSQPAVVQFQALLAAECNALGGYLEQTVDYDGAEQAYRKALAIRERLAREHPTVERYQSELAGTRFNLQIFLGEGVESQPQDESAMRSAVESFERLARDHPGVVRNQVDLANAYNSLGIFEKNRGHADEAHAAYTKALAILAPLVHDHPTLIRPLADSGALENNLAFLLAQQGKTAEARAAYEKAVAIYEQAAARDPGAVEHRRDLARTWFSLGRLLERSESRAEADKAFDKALVLRETLAQADPTVVDLQDELASTDLQLGHRAFEAGQAAQARPWYQKAASALEAIHKAHPKAHFYALNLSAAYLNLGNVARAEGQDQEAVDWYSRGVDALAGPLASSRWQASAQAKLMQVLERRAAAHSGVKHYARAVSDLDRALQHAKPADANRLRAARALGLAHQGDYGRAAAEAKLVAGETPVPESRLYNMACVLSLAAKAAAADPALPDGDRNTRSADYAKHAVTLLHRAAAAGFFRDPKTADLLRVDTDLDPLRSRPDFQALLGPTSTPGNRASPASIAPGGDPGKPRREP